MKASLRLPPSSFTSKLDERDWTREVWLAAFGMARRMIRDRARHGTGAAWTWFLTHAHRRFTTPAAWRIAQAAGRIVFDQRTPTCGTSGDVDALLRQGLVRRTRKPRRGNLLGVVPYRCVTVDRVRALGLTFAWSADPLASSANKGLRVSQARRLREERRRILAELEADDRLCVLTDLGRAALVAAGLAADRVALTPRGSRTPA